MELQKDRCWSLVASVAGQQSEQRCKRKYGRRAQSEWQQRQQ